MFFIYIQIFAVAVLYVSYSLARRFCNKQSFKIKLLSTILFFLLLQPFTFLIFRFLRRSEILEVSNVFIGYSQLLLPMSVYLMFLCIISDLLRISKKYFNKIKNHQPIEASVFVLISTTLCIYGLLNVHNVKLQQYNLNVDKPNIDMNIAFFSDLHIGAAGMTETKLQTAVNLINELDADLILIGGDIIDNSLEPLINGNYINILKQLKSKYGVFAVLGNHDYFDAASDIVIETFAKAGIVTLKDEGGYIQPLNTYLIGRDYTSNSKTHSINRPPRSELSKLVKDMDPTSLKIVIDHAPVGFDEVTTQAVDLQLSGHTHAGQFFPGWLAVRCVFPYVWGQYHNSTSTLIVTSGLGIWGPPIRIATNSEITHIHIQSED